MYACHDQYRRLRRLKPGLGLRITDNTGFFFRIRTRNLKSLDINPNLGLEVRFNPDQDPVLTTGSGSRIPVTLRTVFRSELDPDFSRGSDPVLFLGSDPHPLF